MKDTFIRPRPQQALGRRRGPARLGVQAIEFRGHGPQDFIHHLPDGAQGVLRGNPVLQRHVAEHPGLLPILSTHKTIIARDVLQGKRRSGGVQQAPNAGAKFY